MVLFCLAALIFPTGFYISEVGGQPYKLPNSTVVGSSYVLFVLSIFFTIVGLLFAGKVCLPGWQKVSSHMRSFTCFRTLLKGMGCNLLKEGKTLKLTRRFYICQDFCISDALYDWHRRTYRFNIAFYWLLFLMSPILFHSFKVILVIVILDVMACENNYLNTLHIILAPR